MTLYLL